MYKYLALVLAALALAACGAPQAPAPAAGTAAERQPAAPPAEAAQAAAKPPEAPPSAAQAPAANPPAKTVEQQLAYGEGKRSNLIGFLALPRDAAEPLPGLILIHGPAGLDDTVKSFARRLAGQGYIVLAVDLYGGRVAHEPEAARALAAGVYADSGEARSNLRQAYEYLRKYALAPRIGSIGWAFGGTWSLETALMLPGELDAAVMYSGSVAVDRERLQRLDTPLLGLFGALDKSVSAPEVATFRSTLNELGKQAEVVIYPQAGEELANPREAERASVAGMDAWNRTIAFLDARLKAPAAAVASAVSP